MTKVRILGRRREVERLVEELHRLGLVELADARGSVRPSTSWAASRPVRRAANSSVCSPRRWKRCWATGSRTPERARARWTRTRCAPSWIASRRRSRHSTGALDALRDEAALLPGYLEPLRRLLPLVPELADLDDERAAPAAVGYGRAGPQHRTTKRSSRRSATSSRRSSGPVSSWSGRASRTGRSAVSSSIRTTDDPAVSDLLGRVQVRHAALPEAFGRSRCARPSRRWSAGSRSFPEPSRPIERRARGAGAPASRAPQRILQRTVADELERLRRGGPARRDAARVRRRVLGSASRARAAATRDRLAAWARPSSSRTWRRRRVTRRRRC